MKKNNEKLKRILKILAGTIIALVIGCVIFLCAFMGYVPVVGRLIAESKLSKYAGHKVEARFEWIYVCGYYDVDARMDLHYYLKNNTIYDSVERELIEKEAKTKYAEFKKENKTNELLFPISIDVYSRVDADDFAKAYSRITVKSVRESVAMDDEASRKRMCELADKIISSLGINCTGLYFYYTNQSGDYMIHHDFGKHTIELSDLLQYAEKVQTP